VLEADSASEDRDAVFFDADGDQDLDLYVVSGGYEFGDDLPLLQDRLYLNKSKGVFTKSAGLPQNLSNKTCVRPVDIDNDGDIDLFIGGGVVPGKFPSFAPSKIYFNNGKGNFVSLKPANAALGIVNDALWIDLDKDGKKDLIVAGEWMELKTFLTQGQLFKDVSGKWFPFATNGWWNCLVAGDFDEDGDLDLVAGNYGLNSQLKTDEQRPLLMYSMDIDGNGSVDPLITHYIGNESVPLAFRDDMIGQVPVLKKKFNDYGPYAKAGIHEILTADQLAKAPLLKTNEFKSLYLENTGTRFVKRALPMEAQFSPVYAMAICDLNKDGHADLVLAGNNLYNKIYVGRQDANHGVVMLGDGKGHFVYVPQAESGLNVRGDVRSIVVEGDRLFFGINDGPIKGYRINRKGMAK
jgi:hypothetical protein